MGELQRLKIGGGGTIKAQNKRWGNSVPHSSPLLCPLIASPTSYRCTTTPPNSSLWPYGPCWRRVGWERSLRWAGWRLQSRARRPAGPGAAPVPAVRYLSAGPEAGRPRRRTGRHSDSWRHAAGWCSAAARACPPAQVRQNPIQVYITGKGCFCWPINWVKAYVLFHADLIIFADAFPSQSDGWYTKKTKTQHTGNKD